MFSRILKPDSYSYLLDIAQVTSSATNFRSYVQIIAHFKTFIFENQIQSLGIICGCLRVYQIAKRFYTPENDST